MKKIRKTPEIPAPKPRRGAAPAADRYHHGNLRSSLIEHGLRALEEVGPADVSLRDIARRAGVSANAVYHHFADKEALLAALATVGFGQLGRALDAASRRPEPPRASFLAVGMAYIGFAIGHPALFRLMYGGFTANQTDPALVEASISGFEDSVTMLASYSGRDPEDPTVVDDALVVWSVVHGLSHLALNGQLGYFGPDALSVAAAALERARLPFDFVSR